MQRYFSTQFIIINILVSVVLFVPYISFAQLTGTTTGTSSAPSCGPLLAGGINSLKDLIDFGTCLITKSIIPLLLVLALMFFIYGIIQYFLNPNNIKEREDARKYILWALIGMFVLFSVSGIIQIVRNTFGVTGSPIPLLPETQ